MQFNVLGPLQVLSTGGPLSVGGLKQQTLLGLFLARAGSVVSVPQIVDTLWDCKPPQTVLAQVHSRISSLRHVLGPHLIETHPSGYVLSARPDAIDAKVFEEEVNRAMALRAAGRPGEATAVLRSGLDRWEGPSAFQHLEGELLHREADRLCELRMFALEQRIGADLESGDAAELVPELVDLAAAYPTHERLHRHLMVALHRSGRRGDALTTYLRLRRRLVEELGTDPTGDVQQLYQDLLSMDGASTAAAPPPGQDRAEVVVTSGERPVSPGPSAYQLPPDIPDLVGRHRERRLLVDTFRAASASPRGTAARAAIISGMPGVGKSALALHTAHLVREHFPDGQLYVDTAQFPRTEEGLRGVLGRLLHGLGVPEHEQPGSWPLRQDLYRSITASRGVIVLIDNLTEADDMRAIIPAGGRSAVCMTTQVSGLAVDGAVRLPLGVLSTAEARALLLSGLGPERFTGQEKATEEVLAICANLPMALRPVSNLLAARPHWTLQRMAAFLSEARNPAGLLALSAGRSLADVFDEAYLRLGRANRRALSALAATPQRRLTPATVSTLLGRSDDAAAALLDELTDRNLLYAEPSGGSHEWVYAMHPLLRYHLRAHGADTELPCLRELWQTVSS